jgi:hypothetical protein
MKKILSSLAGIILGLTLMIPVASAQNWNWGSTTYQGQPVYYQNNNAYGYSNPYYTAPTNYYYKKVTKVSPTLKVVNALSTLSHPYYKNYYGNYYGNSYGNSYGNYYYPTTYQPTYRTTYNYAPAAKKYYNYGYKVGNKYKNINGGYYVTNPLYVASNYTWPVTKYAKYWW